jgi:hypothetical protein
VDSIKPLNPSSVARDSSHPVWRVLAALDLDGQVALTLREWMKPVEAPLPKFLAASGHKGMVYREPYGVTLIICPFNGPLLLSLRPAVAALSAGNPCILKLSEPRAGRQTALPSLLSHLHDDRAQPRAVDDARRAHRPEHGAVR